MRPRLFTAEIVQSSIHVAVATIASMRPRLFTAEICASPTRSLSEHPASMRPRLFTAEIVATIWDKACLDKRFNEAAAIHRGNLPDSGSYLWDNASFNEAAAIHRGNP